MIDPHTLTPVLVHRPAWTLKLSRVQPLPFLASRPFPASSERRAPEELTNVPPPNARPADLIHPAEYQESESYVEKHPGSPPVTPGPLLMNAGYVIEFASWKIHLSLLN
jgi:hypothetical protein